MPAWDQLLMTTHIKSTYHRNIDDKFRAQDLGAVELLHFRITQRAVRSVNRAGEVAMSTAPS